MQTKVTSRRGIFGLTRPIPLTIFGRQNAQLWRLVKSFLFIPDVSNFGNAYLTTKVNLILIDTLILLIAITSSELVGDQPIMQDKAAQQVTRDKCKTLVSDGLFQFCLFLSRYLMFLIKSSVKLQRGDQKITR